MTQLITLTNESGVQLKLMTTGAALLSLTVPVGDAQREVLLGCKPEDYLRQQVYLTIGYTVFCQRPFRRADADNFFQSIIRLAYGGQQFVSGS